MKINSFNIDTSDMPTARTVRSFTVTGDKGAEFELIALQSGTLKYYDFQNRVFEDGNAFKKICLVCSSRWSRSDGGWSTLNPPDEYALTDIIGRS